MRDDVESSDREAASEDEKKHSADRDGAVCGDRADDEISMPWTEDQSQEEECQGKAKGQA